ncbi:MAG: lipoyl synthase, partial [Candidatus Aminicenantes bacterium]|nr:lipoyl synthase [Candidatus Aminicenantes bacterium]
RNPENYTRSLRVLQFSHEREFITKSGIMVGLGETIEELIELFRDLRKTGVSLLTIGQYLQPTRQNIAVKKYYSPEEFQKLKNTALSLGFIAVEAGPLVRSSYNAGLIFNQLVNSLKTQRTTKIRGNYSKLKNHEVSCIQ